MTAKDSKKEKIIRKLRGTVVSNKMDKTAVVKVERSMIHPRYRKRYTRTKKYQAADSKNSCQIGDKVEIVQNRPLSKNKKWRVVYNQKQQ